MDKSRQVRVAVVQAGSVPFDTGACIDKAIRLIGEAAATGAKLMVFPEAFVPGYPKGLNYGLVVGARDPAGREEFRIYLDAAIEVPGSETRRLGEAAGAHGSYVVIGVIERDGGTCYCTVLFLWARWFAARQASEAHADCAGTDDLGLRRRLDTHGRRQPLRPDRLGDLLGKLHADAADGDVREERGAVLRADCG